MVNAFFSQLYLSLMAQIKDHAPAIAWIDLDLGQLEHYDIRPAVAFPCVLVDFPDAAYKELGAESQWSEPVIQLRIGFAPFASANSAAPVSAQEQGLQHYELENQVFLALQGWAAEYGGNFICQPLVRTRVSTEQRNDAYRVRVMQFSTAYQDDGARPVTGTVTAGMVITQQ